MILSTLIAEFKVSAFTFEMRAKQTFVDVT